MRRNFENLYSPQMLERTKTNKIIIKKNLHEKAQVSIPNES